MPSKIEEKIVAMMEAWKEILDTNDEDIILEESKPIFKWLIAFDKLMRRTYGDERYEEIIKSGQEDWEKFMSQYKEAQ
jgi:hypothetical protein